MQLRKQLQKSRRSQSGNILLEFVAVVFVITPLVAGTFVTGINLVRSIQANHMARDINDMYIHGTDFSNIAMQQLAKRLATGLNLQVGSALTGTNADNSNNGGNGVVWVTKLQWVGASTDPLCQGISPTNCTNAGKFVVLEQVRFGNKLLDSASAGADPNASHITTAGHPATLPDPNGKTTVNELTNAAAQVPEPYQTKLNALWQSTHAGAGNTALTYGQFLYMTEVYFRQNGSLAGKGVYARWFF